MTGHGVGNRTGSALTAIAPDGDLLYYNNSYDVYFDVDPSPVGKYTVLVVANDKLNASACGATEPCVKNYIERVNLSTGEHNILHTLTYPQHRDGNVHDVDRVSDDQYLVADIANDRAFILNTTSRLIEWEWEVTSAYPLSSAGPWPSRCQLRSFCHTWAHLNDAEIVQNGTTVMISLRNHDQTVFVDRKTGLKQEWTLGEDDNYEVLYEHHNSDYIPPENGGPAVVVADSQNNRLVEYQRVNGSWEQTWTWRDSRLQWPRDADRLPNGHTLVADTNGGRLFEIDTSGEIVWSIEIKSLYDAERLGTGDESEGGPSAVKADLSSRSYTPDPENEPLKSFLRSIVPQTIRSSVAFLLPNWMWWKELGALAVTLTTATVWGSVELWWSSVTVRLQSPVRFER